jgi:hypothetical protein
MSKLAIACMFCNTYKTNRLAEFRNHLAGELRLVEFVCRECGNSFASERYYRTHYTHLHNNQTHRIPEPLNKSIPPNTLNACVLLAACSNRPLTIGDVLVCSKCNNSYSMGASFRTHLLRDHNALAPDFRCSVCFPSMGFVSLELLRLHSLVVHCTPLSAKLLELYSPLETSLREQSAALTFGQHDLHEGIFEVYSARANETEK